MGKKAEKRAAELAEREAELRREIERRKAKKKAKRKTEKVKATEPVKPERKKGKAKKSGTFRDELAADGKLTVDDGIVITAEPEAPVDEPDTSAERDRTVALPVEAISAAAQADIDRSIKARLAEKRAARTESTSAERLQGMHDDVKADRKKRTPKVIDVVKPTEAELEANAAAKAADPEAYLAAQREQVAEVVETERGHVIAVGTPTSDEIRPFAKPSEGLAAGGKLDFETNGNGQYLVKRLTDGKLVGYTRWTTYIDCLEDKTMLGKWSKRIMLEGLVAAEAATGTGEDYEGGIVESIRRVIETRDAAIADARKRDRKGKLEIGELAALVNRAWKEAKTALDAIADDLFELGEGHAKASKGTEIHALTDLYDREGILAVGDLLTAGQITPADLADVEAYAEAMTKLGAKIVDIERVVVNDELGVAGRLDRTAMIKLPALYHPKTGEIVRPAESRARRRVVDLKTGNVEYSIGKIAQQLEGYAGSVGYDLETHEREDLKLDRTTAILIHLPAGSGVATVHVVDLTVGRKGNRLAGDVRSWRNEGKRAIDLKIDVVAQLEREASE